MTTACEQGVVHNRSQSKSGGSMSGGEGGVGSTGMMEGWEEKWEEEQG